MAGGRVESIEHRDPPARRAGEARHQEAGPSDLDEVLERYRQRAAQRRAHFEAGDARRPEHEEVAYYAGVEDRHQEVGLRNPRSLTEAQREEANHRAARTARLLDLATRLRQSRERREERERDREAHLPFPDMNNQNWMNGPRGAAVRAAEAVAAEDAARGRGNNGDDFGWPLGGIWGRLGAMPQLWGGMGLGMGLGAGGGGGGAGDGAVADIMAQRAAQEALRRRMEEDFGMGAGGGMFNFGGFHHQPAGPTIEEQWKGITFKPREKPLTGYTHDFDKEEEPEIEIIPLNLDGEVNGDVIKVGGSSKGQEKKLSLVCCCCMAPLRVSQGQKNSDDRVVALRCGHLIDQKCLMELSKPRPKEEPGPGAGSYVIVSSPVKSSEWDDPESLKTISRGGRKGKAPPIFGAGSSPPLSHAGSSNSNAIQDTPRRLTRAARAALVTDDEESQSMQEALPPTASPAIKRKRGQAMSTTAMKRIKVPKESRVHEWSCPVTGCGRVHTSHEVGGVWETKKDMVVTLFV